MFNVLEVDTVYLACGTTDLRKIIDRLVMIVQTQLKLDQLEKALFVFCNKQMNKMRFFILMRDFGYIITVFKITDFSGYLRDMNLELLLNLSLLKKETTFKINI